MSSNNLPKKPIQLRVIFILNALLMFLPFVFYYAITNDLFEPPSKGGSELNPSWMLYTGIAYILLFPCLVACILKQNLTGLRIVIGLVALVSIPAGAYIGILFSIISMALSFSKPVKAFFND